MSKVSILSGFISDTFRELTSKHRNIKKLPSEYMDKKSGEIRTSTTDSFSMKISDSLHVKLQEVLPQLKDTGVHVRLEEMNLVVIASSPSKVTEKGLMQASCILSHPALPLDLPDAEIENFEDEKLF